MNRFSLTRTFAASARWSLAKPYHTFQAAQNIMQLQKWINSPILCTGAPCQIALQKQKQKYKVNIFQNNRAKFYFSLDTLHLFTIIPLISISSLWFIDQHLHWYFTHFYQWITSELDAKVTCCIEVGLFSVQHKIMPVEQQLKTLKSKAENCSILSLEHN